MTYPEFVEFLKGTGLTPLELAEKIDVSVPTVRRWMSGNFTPHPLMIKGIVERLNRKEPEDGFYQCGCTGLGVECRCWEDSNDQGKRSYSGFTRT